MPHRHGKGRGNTTASQQKRLGEIFKVNNAGGNIEAVDIALEKLQEEEDKKKGEKTFPNEGGKNK